MVLSRFGWFLVLETAKCSDTYIYVIYQTRDRVIHQDFLNSFIVRKQRIEKEITNVTVVWIPDLN